MAETKQIRAVEMVRRIRDELARELAGKSDADDSFQIGKRNMITLRKLLWKNGVLISADETGGLQQSRTMSVQVDSGIVSLRTNGTLRVLTPSTPSSPSATAVGSPRYGP